MAELIEDDMYAEHIKVSDAKKKGYLKSLIVSELPEREGFEKIRLGDIVSQIPRVVLNLDKIDEEQHVLAYINRNETYYGQVRPNENIERRPIDNLFNPAYLLDEDCLIVNASGPAEPRIFDADFGSAFFEDGFAFSLEGFNDYGWLINELNETYVRRQLHPYGMNLMVPEKLEEYDYLNLVLYKEIEGYQEEKAKEEEKKREKWLKDDALKNSLPVGFIVKDGKTEYTIINFISNGSFGYTYRAEMHNLSTGQKEIVALKEYFPRQYSRGNCWHENGKVVYADEFEEEFKDCLALFNNEPEFISILNKHADHHVTELKSFFESIDLGTMFYSMKFYSGASLEDMIKADLVPSSEKLITEKIIIPLCKAMDVMHRNKILHLDIKPENVVIDENGEAVLIDFGVARQYDENGVLLSQHHLSSSSEYSAPEYRGDMKYFSPQADIYAVAATLHSLFKKEGGDDMFGIENLNCSTEMQRTINEGMSRFTNERPSSAQQFLNNFPGCENIKLG
jgi:serine/threonine-protein kinase